MSCSKTFIILHFLKFPKICTPSAVPVEPAHKKPLPLFLLLPSCSNQPAGEPPTRRRHCLRPPPPLQRTLLPLPLPLKQLQRPPLPFFFRSVASSVLPRLTTGDTAGLRSPPRTYHVVHHSHHLQILSLSLDC